MFCWDLGFRVVAGSLAFLADQNWLFLKNPTKRDVPLIERNSKFRRYETILALSIRFATPDNYGACQDI